MRKCGLYIISPEKIVLKKFSEQLKQALSGGVEVFQLRLKNVPDEFIVEAATKLLGICNDFGTQFILNDRPDLAKMVNADGVHIGEEQDGTYENARKVMGDNKVVGVSCYGSLDRAANLAAAGADYVAFGAFYPTTTKTPKARPDFDIISWWVRNSIIPCVAIGGINANNCKPLVEAGADLIAVVSTIWKNPELSPKDAVLELNGIIDSLIA